MRDSSIARPGDHAASGTARPRAGWPASWGLHGFVLTVLALGGAVGLVLWGKWGFLIAFDTLRTYCF